MIHAVVQYFTIGRPCHTRCKLCYVTYVNLGGVTPYYTCQSNAAYSGVTSDCTGTHTIPQTLLLCLKSGKLVLHCCKATNNYCSNTPPQTTLANTASTPTPVRTAATNTYFTCATGYLSTGAYYLLPRSS